MPPRRSIVRQLLIARPGPRQSTYCTVFGGVQVRCLVLLINRFSKILRPFIRGLPGICLFGPFDDRSDEEKKKKTRHISRDFPRPKLARRGSTLITSRAGLPGVRHGTVTAAGAKVRPGAGNSVSKGGNEHLPFCTQVRPLVLIYRRQKGSWLNGSLISAQGPQRENRRPHSRGRGGTGEPGDGKQNGEG